MALTPRQRAYLLEGPGPNESRHDVLRAFDGPCALIVAWRRVRAEFMAACPPGRRPYGYWLVERRLKAQPAGEAGELRAIRDLELYRDDAEREYVHRRLAEITAELRAGRHLSRVA